MNRTPSFTIHHSPLNISSQFINKRLNLLRIRAHMLDSILHRVFSVTEFHPPIVKLSFLIYVDKRRLRISRVPEMTAQPCQPSLSFFDGASLLFSHWVQFAPGLYIENSTENRPETNDQNVKQD